MSGTTDNMKGRVKEAVGALSDNDKLRDEGKADQIVGKVKDGAEKIADKAKEVAAKAKDGAERLVDKAKDVADKVVDKVKGH